MRSDLLSLLPLHITDTSSSENQMRQIEIGEIWSMEVEDLKLFNPKDNEPFSILIDIEIGIKGEIGKDDFRFTLANSLGVNHLIEHELKENLSSGISLNNFNIICIKGYSYVGLIELLCKRLKDIDTNGSWKFIASQINKLMYWEYEREERSRLK